MSDICPISGKFCKNNKNYNVTNVGPDYTYEKSMHCCGECYDNLENNPKNNPKKPTGSSLFGGFLGLLHLLVNLIPAEPSPPKNVQDNTIDTNPSPCPNCGCTLEYIAKKSRTGCSLCYDHFKNDLIPILAYLHKATIHNGKQPKNRPVSVQELQTKMQKAVDEEQYETAAELKRQIEKLKF